MSTNTQCLVITTYWTNSSQEMTTYWTKSSGKKTLALLQIASESFGIIFKPVLLSDFSLHRACGRQTHTHTHTQAHTVKDRMCMCVCAREGERDDNKAPFLII